MTSSWTRSSWYSSSHLVQSVPSPLGLPLERACTGRGPDTAAVAEGRCAPSHIIPNRTQKSGCAALFSRAVVSVRASGWLRMRIPRALPAGPRPSPRLRSGAQSWSSSSSSGGGGGGGENGGHGAGGAGGWFRRDAGGERGGLYSATRSLGSRFVEPFFGPSLRRSGGQRYPQSERQETPWLPAGQRRQPRPQRHHPGWWGTRRCRERDGGDEESGKRLALPPQAPQGWGQPV